MIRDGQRLVLAGSISKAEVAPSLANNLVPKRSECLGSFSAGDPRKPCHVYSPTATLPMSSPAGSGIGSPLACMSSIVRAIASRALARASSTESPWL